MKKVIKQTSVILTLVILLISVRPTYFLLKSHFLAREARILLQSQMAQEDTEVKFISVSSSVYSDLISRIIFLTERSPRKTIHLSVPEGCTFFSQGFEIIRSPETLEKINPVFDSPDFQRMTAFVDIVSASILNSCNAKGILGNCSSTIGGSFSYTCR